LSAIGAGEEFFLSYGEPWLEQRDLKDVPLGNDFKEANRILGSIWSLLTLEGASIDDEIVSDLLELIKKDLEDKPLTNMLLDKIRARENVEGVVDRNGMAQTTIKPKSHNWLEKNGYCLDHLYVKNSTIRDIGNGGFARRQMKKGSVIHSSPLVAAPRDFLEMNHPNAQINSKQLIMNYHFGHIDSSLLFMPLTQLTAVNHQSKRMGQEPNAKVAFSRRHPKTRYMLERSLRDIAQEDHWTVILDVVATRDIEPDEEVRCFRVYFMFSDLAHEYSLTVECRCFLYR
jgi:hypothetical protein